MVVVWSWLCIGRVDEEQTCHRLQENIGKFFKWSKECKIKFNMKKCTVMVMGKGRKRSSWNYKTGNGLMARRQEKKDLVI